MVCGKSWRENQFVHMMRGKPAPSLTEGIAAVCRDEGTVGNGRYQINKLVGSKIW